MSAATAATMTRVMRASERVTVGITVWWHSALARGLAQVPTSTSNSAPSTACGWSRAVSVLGAARGQSTGHPLLLRTAWALVALLALGLPSRADAQTADTPSFAIEDHRADLSGNIRLTTDEYGAVVCEAIHLPFGERDTGECGTVECGTRGDDGRPLGYQGTPRDPTTCFDDFGARDYAAATCRFQTVDPVLPVDRALRDPQPGNRYAYARNNPLIYSDSDGRFIVPLVVASVSASYVYFEAASTAYDVYDAAKTLTDRNASTGAKAMAVGAVILGTMTVGSGSVWVKGGKKVAEHASDAMNAAKGAAKAKTVLGPLRVRATWREPQCADLQDSRGCLGQDVRG